MELFKNHKLQTHLHTTSEENAKLILKYGFFVDSYLENTTDQVSDTTFSFWFNYRKSYGKCIIVIQIPKKILSKNLHKTIIPDDEQCRIFNKIEQELGEELEIEWDYILPNYFIKGYYKRGDKYWVEDECALMQHNEFIENPAFNPFK